MPTEGPADLYARVAGVLADEEVLELARRLVAADTVTGNEAALAGLLAEELAAVGMEVDTEEFAPGRPNVYGTTSGGDGPTLLVAGHVDTVGVEGWREYWGSDARADAWGGAVVDGALWGLGAADEKGGVAATIAALRALRRLGIGPVGDLVVACLGDEESGQPATGRSEGALALAARLEAATLPRPDFAIYTEPTSLDVYAAQPGFLIATITLTGKSSYFAYPDRGRDALRGAHRMLGALYDYGSELGARPPHPSVGRPVLVVTSIHGGESVAVPERCELSLIRTLLPSETLEGARDELDELVGEVSSASDLVGEVAYSASRNHPLGGTPAEIDPSHPIAAQLREWSAIESPDAAVTGAPYWSELPILAELGIPGVYFGPGDISVCHTPSEHVAVAELGRSARALAALLATAWLGGAPLLP